MKLFALVLVLILLSMGSASALEAHSVEIELQENGNSLIKNLFFIDSNDRDNFFVTLNNPQNIQAYDSRGALNFSMSDSDIFVALREKVPGYSFTVEYVTDTLTSKNGSEWTFAFDLYKLGEFNSSQLTVILPPGASLLSYSNEGIVYLDNNRINIDFGIQPNDPVTSVEVKYTFSQLPPDNVENNFLLITTVIIVIVIMVSVLIMVFKKKPEKPKKHESHKEFSQHQEDILKTLTSNEEKIIGELSKHKDGLTQKKLTLETGIPKATMSRTLKTLKSKTLVEIKDYGYTKKISLAKWFISK